MGRYRRFQPRNEPAGAATSGAIDRSRLWSLAPLRDPTIPKVKQEGWAKSDIDAFILSKLEEKGLTPAVAADRRILLRRATFDLTGLPPTPEEVDAFLTDNRSTHLPGSLTACWPPPPMASAGAGIGSTSPATPTPAVIRRDYPVPQAYSTATTSSMHSIRTSLTTQFLREQIAGDLLPATDQSRAQGDRSSPPASWPIARRFSDAAGNAPDHRRHDRHDGAGRCWA